MNDNRPLPTNVIEALQATKEVLQRQGRIRRTRFHYGKVCLVGAIDVAVGMHSPTGTYLAPPTSQLELSIRTLHILNRGARFTTRHDNAIEFNDNPDTTDGQVFALIDQAIAAEGAPPERNP